MKAIINGQSVDMELDDMQKVLRIIGKYLDAGRDEAGDKDTCKEDRIKFWDAERIKKLKDLKGKNMHYNTIGKILGCSADAARRKFFDLIRR